MDRELLSGEVPGRKEVQEDREESECDNSSRKPRKFTSQVEDELASSGSTGWAGGGIRRVAPYPVGGGLAEVVEAASRESREEGQHEEFDE